MSAARSRTRSAARRSARSSRTWPHTSATRSARSAGSRSRRPRITSRSSTTAATAHDKLSGRPATMRASRGWTGSPTIARPSGVMAPPASSAPSACSSSSACCHVLRGGGSTNARSATGVPHAATSRREPGEVDLGDLGGPMGRAGAVLHAAPQPVGGARLGAPGPPGALLGRVAADRHGRQPGHPGPRVEARGPGEPAVDDDAHPFHGQRRLGDVGRQHDAPPARRGRGQRLVLLLEGERAGQAMHVDVGTEVELLGDPVDLADPGEEHEHVAVLVAQRPPHGRADGGLEAVVACRAAASARRRGTSARRSRRRAPASGRRWPADRRTARCRRSPTSPRCAGRAAASPPRRA